MSGLSGRAGNVVRHGPVRAGLVGRIVRICGHLLVPLDAGGLDTSVVDLAVVDHLKHELTGVFIADEFDETGIVGRGLRLVVLLLGVLGDTIPIRGVHLDLLIGILGDGVRVHLLFGRKLLVARIETGYHIVAAFTRLEGSALAEDIDVGNGLVILSLTPVCFSADQIHLGGAHQRNVTVGILGRVAGADWIVVLEIGRNACRAQFLQLREVVGVI